VDGGDGGHGVHQVDLVRQMVQMKNKIGMLLMEADLTS